MSTGIFLGSDEIKYNGSPVGNMRVGGTNICKAYVGSTQVFDNCAQANSNVQLQLDLSGLNASSAGYSITGDTTGTTKSGQPNSSYSKFTTNISAINNYTWTSGPTVNDAPAGTFPSTPGSTTIVTTTITGTLQAPANSTTAQLNVTNGITGWAEGDSGTVNEDPDNGQDQTRTAGSVYSFTVSVSALNPGWQLDSAITGTGTYSGTHPSSPQFFPVNVSLGGQVSLINYTITPGTISYNVTNGTVGNQFTAGSWTTGAQSGTKNNSYSFALSGLAADSANGYSWQGGSATITYSIAASGNFSQTATINATVSGQINQAVNTASLSGWNGSSKNAGQNCANHACIQSGTSFTAYYTGNLATATLYTNSSLTNSLPSGWYGYGGSQSVNYSAGSFSPVACIPSVTYTAVATGGYPCGNPLVDYWYINGGFTPAGPLNFVSSTSDGCGGTSVTINDGNYWTTTSAAGYGASSGSC
jgi:hypothetical protein